MTTTMLVQRRSHQYAKQKMSSFKMWIKRTLAGHDPLRAVALVSDRQCEKNILQLNDIQYCPPCASGICPPCASGISALLRGRFGVLHRAINTLNKYAVIDILLRNDTIQCWIEGTLISRRGPVFKTIWYDAHPQKERERERERGEEESTLRGLGTILRLSSGFLGPLRGSRELS